MFWVFFGFFGGFLVDIFDLLPSSRKNVNFRKSDWKMGWKCQLLTFFSEFKKILWKSTQKFKIFKTNSRKIKICSGKFEIFKISTFILRPTLAFLRYKNLKISLRGWKWGYNVNFENFKMAQIPVKMSIIHILWRKPPQNTQFWRKKIEKKF